MKKLFKKFNILLTTLLFMFISIGALNAASASISISSSTSKVVIGNTFTVTIKISSSAALGSWEFTPSYDTSKFKLVSGETPVVDYSSNSSTKSKSYTYKFKAIATGSGKITVKSYGAYGWDESKLSMSVGSKQISIITQAELEASYSKNNNLKSLSVDGLKLNETFKSDTLNYTVDADSNTTNINIKASVEDSKSTVSGTGTQSVYEGENKFLITVTAQNGSTKTYTLIVNVVDPNPIEVTIDDNKYTVVKRESILETPENFEKTTLTINEQNVPAFYNELNDFMVVGLKDNEGEISFYLYNQNNNTYTKYNEIKLDQLNIYPLSIDKTFDESYIKSTTIINDVTFESLKMKNSDYSIIHAQDLSTGKDNYYKYDSETNTMIRFTEEDTEPYKKDIKDYKEMIIFLGIESILITLILICILFSNLKKNKKRDTKDDIKNDKIDLTNEKEEKKKEEKEIEEEKTNKKDKKQKDKKKDRKKVSVDEEEKDN